MVTYYDYDGRPAKREGSKYTVMLEGGKERNVADLVGFMHEAYEVPRHVYDRLVDGMKKKTT